MDHYRSEGVADGRVRHYRLLNNILSCSFCDTVNLAISTTKLTFRAMNGARAINAIELHKISEYLQVSLYSLMEMPEKPMDTSVIHSFMGRVKTEEARKGI